MSRVKHFAIINLKGSPVLVRAFETAVDYGVCDDFFRYVSDNPMVPPFFELDGRHYMFTFHNDLYFVLVSSDTMPPLLNMEILESFPQLITDFTGRCTELSIQHNLALVCELVDEVLSSGCPQTKDPNKLLHLINNNASSNINAINTDRLASVFQDRPITVDTAKNEGARFITFTIIEKISATIAPSGEVIDSGITGICKVRSLLPEGSSCTVQLPYDCTFRTLTMNKDLPLDFDDIIFSPICNTSSFALNRQLSFSPRIGDIELFRYRTSRYDQPFISLKHFFENRQTKVVTILMSVVLNLPPDRAINDVVIRFQCPTETSNASCELSTTVHTSQKAAYDQAKRQVWWEVFRFQGQMEYSARFKFFFDDGIPGAAESILGPISLEFTAPGCLHSGMSLELVNLQTGGYEAPSHSIRTASIAGDFIFELL